MDFLKLSVFNTDFTTNIGILGIQLQLFSSKWSSIVAAVDKTTKLRGKEFWPQVTVSETTGGKNSKSRVWMFSFKDVRKYWYTTVSEYFKEQHCIIFCVIFWYFNFQKFINIWKISVQPLATSWQQTFSNLSHPLSVTFTVIIYASGTDEDKQRYRDNALQKTQGWETWILLHTILWGLKVYKKKIMKKKKWCTVLFIHSNTIHHDIQYITT